MPSRQELNLRARVVNIAAGSYPNDSNLEQVVLNAEKNVTAAAGTATVLAVSNAGTKSDVAAISGSRDLAAVTGVAPYNTVAPTITGTAQVGGTLTATNGTWGGTATITYTHQWYRNGVAIDGATGTTRVLAAADLGTRISVVVTGTNAIGATIATSLQTNPVIPA